MAICSSIILINSTFNYVNDNMFVLCADDETLVKISAAGSVPSPRSAATITAVDSKLYLFGGLSNDCGWLGDFHVFDTGQRVLFMVYCNIDYTWTVVTL